MATRTISNAGGNYNATATWVEAAVPTSADDVVATATSGQLTVNVSSAARSFNFTNYTNTLTMNNTWTVNGASLTNTFVSGMSITGNSNIAMTGNAQTIVTNGLTIPNMSWSSNKTLGDDLNITNWTSGSLTISGTRNINVSGNCLMGTINQVVGANITLNIIGTGNYTGGASSLLAIIFNTAGTITFSDASGIGISIAAAAPTTQTIQYIQGTLAGTRRLRTSLQAANNTVVLDLGSSNWTEVNYQISSAVVTDITNLSLTSNLNVGLFNMWANSAGRILRISGNGRIIATTIQAMPWTYNSGGTIVRNFPNIQLASSATHSASIINFSGADDTTNRMILSSQTASTTGYLSCTGTHSIQNVTITDIDATGGPLSVWRSSLTRTTAITNYTSFGGGISGGSFTFVN